MIDGEFWSRGELLRARGTLHQKDQPQDATIDDFMSLSNEADRLYQRIEQIIRQAGTDYLSSQVCIQISSSVYESLQERGWYLREETDYTFTSDDEREPLSLKMYSPAEDQVEFVFRLNGELTMRPEFSGVHNRGVMEQLAGVLQAALDAFGVEVQSVIF